MTVVESRKNLCRDLKRIFNYNSGIWIARDALHDDLTAHDLFLGERNRQALIKKGTDDFLQQLQRDDWVVAHTLPDGSKEYMRISGQEKHGSIAWRFARSWRNLRKDEKYSSLVRRVLADRTGPAAEAVHRDYYLPLIAALRACFGRRQLRIIEVGASIGEMSEYYRQGGHRYDLIENNPDRIALGKRQGANGYVLCNAGHMRHLGDGEVDAVISKATLCDNQLENEAPALDEVYRVLKPGSFLILHQARLSEAKRLLDKNKFEIVHIHRAMPYIDRFVQLHTIIARKI